MPSLLLTVQKVKWELDKNFNKMFVIYDETQKFMANY